MIVSADVPDLPAGPDNPFLTWRPPGHFYSPVPDMTSIARRGDEIWRARSKVPGVELRETEQRALFVELAALARDVHLPESKQPERRYYTQNVAFGMGDALMLNAMLRRFRPANVVEIGSGHSSALMLDTDQLWLDGSTRFTFVEPYPELLNSLLTPADLARVQVLSCPAQEMPTDVVSGLLPGDFLFVDSTHVLKLDSDVRHIFAEVLPAVGSGVFVHFHDIFWPFEYPRAWVTEGRAWNESYMLQAFLQFNAAFEIVLWNDWLNVRGEGIIADRLPVMLENTGGSIWLRRL